jgi:hypothetical protein
VGYESPSIIKYLEPTTGQMFRARFLDCVFDETIFPKVGKIGEIQPPEERLLKSKDGLFTRTTQKGMVEVPTDMAKVNRLIKHVVDLHKLSVAAPDAFAPAQGVVKETGVCSNLRNIPADIEISAPAANVAAPRKRQGRPVGSRDSQPRKRRSTLGLNLQIEEMVEGELESHQTQTNVLPEDNDPDPCSINEAKGQRSWPHWQNAIQTELRSIQKHDVFGEVEELPKGVRPIGQRLVFNKKLDGQGNLARYKARLVAKGFTQRLGID